MRIVFVVETYSDGVGYIENCLPPALAKLGHEVVTLTAGLPPYFFSKNAFFEKINKSTAPEDRICDFGVGRLTVRFQPYVWVGNRVYFRNLSQALAEIKPDLVIARGLSSPVVAQVVWAKFKLGFKLATSTGQAYSVVRDALAGTPFKSFIRKSKFFLTRYLVGWLLSKSVDVCIGSTQDCVDLAVDWYGYPKNRCCHIPLGVDTDHFHPVVTDKDKEERRALRGALGISDDEVVVVWTGRMVPGKMISLLADAVEVLVLRGHKVRALFVGDGPEQERLQVYPHSVLVSFVEWTKLAAYYRVADLACWPRSITTSTLDAAACGLPIVMSNKETATERWDGFGQSYEEGDLDSLVGVLDCFMAPLVRARMGQNGARRMSDSFSWRRVAERTVLACT